jgi:hypothetical protein
VSGGTPLGLSVRRGVEWGPKENRAEGASLLPQAVAQPLAAERPAPTDLLRLTSVRLQSNQMKIRNFVHRGLKKLYGAPLRTGSEAVP